MRLREYANLVSPPFVVAGAAEGMAGALLGGASLAEPGPYLFAVSSALLFAAGAVFGHWFDREADAQAAPERPIPAGAVTAGRAWLLGWLLLVPGAALPALGGLRSAAVGLGVALVLVLHAAVTKNTWGLGFATVGLARGLNLMLGLTAGEFGPENQWVAAAAVGLYGIGWAVLRASRQRLAPASAIVVGLLHLVAALGLILYLYQRPYFLWLDALPLLVLALGLSLPRLVDAAADPRRPAALEAVQYSYLSLTLLEAMLVAGTQGLPTSLPVAALAGLLYLTLRRHPLRLAPDLPG